MGVRLKFTVDGLDYSNDIEGGVDAFVRKGIIEEITEKTRPFMDELEAQGGSLIYDFGTGSLNIEKCSPDLESRIMATFD
jgi:hypothetical protein